MHQRWFIHHLLKDILIASKFGQLWIEWLKHSWAGFLCEYSSQHLWENIKKQDYSALWWNLPRSKPQYYGGGSFMVRSPQISNSQMCLHEPSAIHRLEFRFCTLALVSAAVPALSLCSSNEQWLSICLPLQSWRQVFTLCPASLSVCSAFYLSG